MKILNILKLLFISKTKISQAEAESWAKLRERKAFKAMPGRNNHPLQLVDLKSAIVAEWRLRCAQKFYPPKFLEICAARGIDSESLGTAPEYTTQDFRDWPKLGQTVA